MQMPRSISEGLILQKQGQLTALQWVEASLNCISTTDDSIAAWVMVDAERARTHAAAADLRLLAGKPMGPLHGVPVGIKDLIDVADWPTAAGSNRWRSAVARQDAACIQNLRSAGAIILGKTVTTAFASFDPSPTRNPMCLDRTPGGSSAGSAAAVAAGHCLVALGTQTGGSILRPASYCGIAGYKPTRGLISLDGVVPLAPSLDHVGVLARNVEDLALVSRVIAVKPARLNKFQQPLKPILLVDTGLAKSWADADANECFLDSIRKLESHGWEVRDHSLPGLFHEVLEHHRVLMATEAYAWHAERWERHPHDYPPRITSLLEEGARARSDSIHKAQEYKQILGKLLRKWLPDNSLLLTPTTPTSPPDRNTTGDPRFQSPWSFLGWPTITVPAGLCVNGYPLGLQIIGRKNSDNSLLDNCLGIESIIRSTS
jgi:aspartyl-tRNA(Asn)/glutamyl-tRNA(Gln) amidotransferase subunit A